MPTPPSCATLLLALSLAVPATSAAAESTYRVQRGDSLSSISARMLNDADRWREIWALNPHIRTPKLLQAGTRLRLPDPIRAPEAPVSDSKPTSEQGTAADAIQVMAEELIRSGHVQRLRTNYRLLDRPTENRPRIHAVRSEADGQYLYIHGLSDNTPANGLYGLFRQSSEPAGTSFLELTRIGQARQLLRQGDKARLKITEARQPHLEEAWILPLAEPQRAIRPNRPDRPVNARIVKALYEQPGGYLLLLNQGQRAGIRPGHLLEYSRPNPVASASGETLIFPHNGGGWMLVIETAREASLALVIQARQIPAVGDQAH